MKPLLGILALSLSSVCVTAPAVAQTSTFPDRPIKIVVPFPPGGSTDVLFRMIGPRLSERLGQTVVIENKPGAAATVGADNVARSNPDGYTLLAASAHHTIAQAVLPTLNYRIDKSFAPIGTVAMVPNLVVVNSTLPVEDIDQLVAHTKIDPGRYNYGSAGPGTAHHLIGEMFKQRTGAQLTHIPYSGSAPAVTGLLSDQVQVMFDTVPSALPHIKSGKTRALATTTARRSTALPNVPTLQQSGLEGFDVGTWMGLVAPAGTPPEVVERLNREMVAVVNDPAVQQQLLNQGIEPDPSTPEALQQRIEREVRQFGDLVKQAKLKVE
ncbi:Bug family tripartite tricarboxylate transporter substrate binding protein [Bordetella sp. 02P26C-1]|uniref:Bug family tripartite tricarboxylate transporter substrate binding protein n=1 Tax=Bordetella sp. 02P26C-1 TaxID=2683195 RepID=UPI0013554ABF|nr:tripartite tricarboxylate transporter substrate binding protein [Bordetella sp. 02P26C-1]MVW80701.1 tripartite tricarboxylate transporter substrate binding protein [Bordetella sp. 02P26C-1]